MHLELGLIENGQKKRKLLLGKENKIAKNKANFDLKYEFFTKKYSDGLQYNNQLRPPISSVAW